MQQYGRNTPKNYGGSYSPPNNIQERKEPSTFLLKEKISDMMKYGLPLTDGFPRRERRLADTLRNTMLEMYRLAVRIQKKYYKKTTLEDLDIELAVLKEFVVIASDKDYRSQKYAPPLTIHQREVWSRYNDEIGRMIGGYKQSLGLQAKPPAKPEG